MVRDLAPGPAGEPVRDAILDWDGVMAAGSRGAAAFAAWRNALTTRLCAEPAFAAMRDDSVYGPLFAPYLSLEASVGWGIESLANAGTPYGIDLRRLATEALEDAAGHPDAWGDTHVFDPTHAFDLADPDLAPPRVPTTPVSRRHRHGPRDRVAAGPRRRGLPRLDGPLRLGPRRPRAERLGGPDGRLGRPRTPHHVDQLEAWAEARLLPVELDWERLSPEE